MEIIHSQPTSTQGTSISVKEKKPYFLLMMGKAEEMYFWYLYPLKVASFCEGSWIIGSDDNPGMSQN